MEPRPRRRRPAAERRRRERTARGGPPRPVRRAGRVRGGAAPRRPRAPGQRTPRDHRLRPHAGAVRRGPRRPARHLADGLRRRCRALHARLAGGHHRGPGRGGSPGGTRVRRQRGGVPRPVDDRHGRRHQPLVPLGHDLPRVPHADQPHRLPGGQRRRLGTLRGAGRRSALSRGTPRWPTRWTGPGRHAT